MKLLNKLGLLTTTLAMLACSCNATTKYSVSFEEHKDNVILTGNGDYNEGTSATIKADFVEGYEFDKWTSNSKEVSKENPYSFTVTENISFKAEYTLKEYSISYDCDGGSLLDAPTTYTIESETITLPTPTKQGFAFLNWVEKDTQNVISTIEKGTTGNIEVVANWKDERINISISYNNKRGTVTGGGKVLPGSITLNATPNKGYAFDGWYKNNTLLNKNANATISFTEDSEIEARFSPIEYKIIYTLNEGVLPINAPTTYTIESDTIILPTPSKTNYDFAGWVDSNSKPITEIVKGSTGDINVIATWSKNTILVTLICDPNKGGVGNSEYYSANTTFAINAYPADGYKFEGWYVDGECVSNNEVAYFMAHDDITFEARFTAIVYNIIYKLDGGKLPQNAPLTFTVESGTITLPTPTKDSTDRYSYEFVGWKNVKGEFVSTIGAKTIGDVELTAVWEETDTSVKYRLITDSSSWNYKFGIPFNRTISDDIFTLTINVIEGESIAVDDGEAYIYNYVLDSASSFDAFHEGCATLNGHIVTFSVAGEYYLELNVANTPTISITIL